LPATELEISSKLQERRLRIGESLDLSQSHLFWPPNGTSCFHLLHGCLDIAILSNFSFTLLIREGIIK
jgi:hypothetical protein